MSENAIPARRRVSKASVFRGGSAAPADPPAAVRPLVGLKPLTFDAPAEEQAQAKPSTPTRARKTPTSRKKTGEEQASSNRVVDVPIAARLPVSLVERLDKRREDADMTSVKVMFHALVETLDELPALLAADARAQDTPAESIGMFDLGTASAPREREVQRMWRVSQKNADMIDDLVTRTGAGSRQRLLRVALTAYLEPTAADEA